MGVRAHHLGEQEAPSQEPRGRPVGELMPCMNLSRMNKRESLH
jgi:hypothetical protein